MSIVSPRPSLIIFQDVKPLKGEGIWKNTACPLSNTLLEEVRRNLPQTEKLVKGSMRQKSLGTSAVVGRMPDAYLRAELSSNVSFYCHSTDRRNEASW
ncbi:hypothetical protein TNCV_2445281 [Trichonephila clavipes]|nr:hypothetical protein TNCV_2445281 [Trichonephila clavipes]